MDWDHLTIILDIGKTAKDKITYAPWLATFLICSLVVRKLLGREPKRITGEKWQWP